MLRPVRTFAKCVSACTLALAVLYPVVGAEAAGFKVLYSFKGRPDGIYPRGSLIADAAGNLYGTTFHGGAAKRAPGCGALRCGTVFALAPNGTETVLHSFAGNQDGALPGAGLVGDGAGNYFGIAGEGGGGKGCLRSGCGAVFKIAADGSESVIYAFAKGSHGYFPTADLVLMNGFLYGTTFLGGLSDRGTDFKLSTTGSETVIHAFTGGTDGAYPGAGLIADSAGNFYGTTESGGTGSGAHCPSGGCGTIYKIATDGSEKVLYSFQDGSDGFWPTNRLAVDSAGNLYGAGNNAGAYGNVFKLAANGTFTLLHVFKGPPNDGANPFAGVILDQAGNLYGTTYFGGSGVCGGTGCGTVYKVAPNGSETVLHSFCQRTNCVDGAGPSAGLLLENGYLYGTTARGGDYDGIVFRLNQ